MHAAVEEREAAPGLELGLSSSSSSSPSVEPVRRRDAPWVASTYFAEGLPYSLVHQVAAELFTALGASLQSIGLISLFGLAWNGKFAWSPLVERFGSTRRWLVATEVIIGLLVLCLALPAQAADLRTASVLLAIIAFASATHDIAVDGYYLRALPPDQQTSLSGLRIAAYRIALLVGKGALVWLAGKASWGACFAVGGGLMLVLAAGHAVVLPKEAARHAAEARRGAAFVDELRSLVEEPGMIVAILFVLTFRAGDAMMFAMSTPLLKDLGLDTATRGVVSGIGGTLASIVGSVIGSAIITRATLKRALLPIAVVQSAAILLFVWLAWARPSGLAIAAVVLVEQLVAGAGTAAFLVFLVRRSAGDHKVFRFAVLSALMSVATTLTGSASGYVAGSVGFPAFFALAFAASLPGVALARVAPTE